MADDTPTLPGEWAELESWHPDSPDQLQPVCLLHDLPLEEGSGMVPVPGPGHVDRVAFWHWLRCPTCARPVALMSEMTFAGCYYHGKVTVQDILDRRQMELRYMTLLAYYQHLRNGWRLYDHSVAARVMPQPQTPEQMREYMARHIEERDRVVQHG